MKKLALAVVVFNVVVVGACLVGLAQELPQYGESPLAAGLKAIAAAIAFAGGALGTAIAQSRIGPAAVAAVAEDQKNFLNALIFIAIPETLVVFGFVVIFLL
uniref:ATP synthase F(0) sector subunit c n=2 Tax=Candidatus Bipolaricaulota TaxID=67810 RepID=H5SNE9_9BACT|nr:V-type H+-transporting ATPase subunit K [uncultured Acetothermia bacterium]BAL59369.1 V-type H+-transporting ATPase subunit K [Candidatus Acetothermum autotrophicum]